jgi:hypothetical protein
MKKLLIYTALLTMAVIFVFLQSCNRKTPQVTYINETKTQFDTIISYFDGVTDTLYSTVPCDSFYMVIHKTDTVFRTPIINNPRSRKTIIKNSQIGDDNQKSKSGDNINGDANIANDKKTAGNTNTGEGATQKDDHKKIQQCRHWIYVVVGMLLWFIIQNVVWTFIKNSNPFTKAISTVTDIIN